MNGIRTFWKKSKIFRIIIVFPFILILSLLGISIPVAASSAYDYNTEEITVTDGGITYSGALTPIGFLNEDSEVVSWTYAVGGMPLPYHDTNFAVVYEGDISVSHLYNFSTTNDVVVYHEGYIVGMVANNIVISVTGENITQSDGTDLSDSKLNGYTKDSISVIDYSTTANYGISNDPRVSNVTKTKVTLYDIVNLESNFVSLGTIRHNYSVRVRLVVNFSFKVTSAVNDTLFTYDDLLEKIFASRITPTVTSTYSDSVLYGSVFNFREMIEHIDTKLYNQYITLNLIYSKLTSLDSTTSDIYQQLLQLSNDLELDDSRILQAIVAMQSQLHTDNTTTQDIMQNDRSGWSDNMDDWKTDFDSVQASADSAVDSAYLDYSSDLATVDNYNWTGFFTGQQSAATFWRNVGEYILDSANLGYVAGGLIICTLVTLFVFLLRL